MADIRLEIAEYGRAFQAGDDIRGLVKIHFLKTMDLQNVQVKLLGLSHTRVYRNSGQNGQRQRRVEYNEVHELVYDVFTVFPPPEMDGVLKSMSYTLQEGKTLESNFHFKLPFTAHCGDPVSKSSSHFNRSEREQRYASAHSRNDTGFWSKKHLESVPLPPSFRTASARSGHKAWTEYFLKVTVRKSGTLSMNVRQEFPFTMTIPPPDPFPEDDEVMAVSNVLLLSKKKDPEMSSFKAMFKSDAKIELHFRVVLFRPRFIIAGQTMNPRVLLLSSMSPHSFMSEEKKGEERKSNGLGKIYVREIEMALNDSTRYNAKGHTEKDSSEHGLFYKSTIEEIDLCKMTPTQDHANVWMLGPFHSKYALDISHLFAPVVFPKTLTPTFETCNITHKHELNLKIKFATSVDSWGSTKCKISHKCVVVSNGTGHIEQIEEELPGYTA